MVTFQLRTPSEITELIPAIAAQFPDMSRAHIGLHELLMNAVEHGNLGIGFDEKRVLIEKNCWRTEIDKRLQSHIFGARHVTVTLERGEGFAAVTVQDEGKGFDWRPYLEFRHQHLQRSHGRGIAIASTMGFDVLEYSDNGRRVRGVMFTPYSVGLPRAG